MRRLGALLEAGPALIQNSMTGGRYVAGMHARFERDGVTSLPFRGVAPVGLAYMWRLVRAFEREERADKKVRWI